MVDLTTESASVRASTVDHSRYNVLKAIIFVVSVLLSALSMSEKVQYGYFSCPGNTLCWISSESEALIGFYTARVVSPNLALLGAQYSFELVGAQDPLSLKIYLTKMDTFCAG